MRRPVRSIPPPGSARSAPPPPSHPPTASGDQLDAVPVRIPEVERPSAGRPHVLVLDLDARDAEMLVPGVERGRIRHVEGDVTRTARAVRGHRAARTLRRLGVEEEQHVLACAEEYVATLGTGDDGEPEPPPE